MNCKANQDHNSVTLTINRTKSHMYQLEMTAMVVGIILETQQSCADIKVRIGGVKSDGTVQHLGIYILDCPIKYYYQ